MIFATCGSSHFPFDRMMEALRGLPAEQLYVQHGPAEPPPHTHAVEFLPFDILVDQIAVAEVVISHAGVGSILCAIRAGHTPVIFPRLKRYNETVDDHQMDLCKALADQGTAVVVWHAEDMADAVRSVPARGAGAHHRPGGLVDAVRTAIVSGRTTGLSGAERRLVASAR